MPVLQMCLRSLYRGSSLRELHGCRNSSTINRAVFGLLSKVRTGELSKAMRKVTVNIPEVHISYITLEVDDDASDYDIKDKANAMLEAGDYRDML